MSDSIPTGESPSESSSESYTSLSTITIDRWVDWPMPSLTSAYNINVRYYATLDETLGTSMRLDLGPHVESLLEELYGDMLDNAVSMTPLEFEKYVRDFYQAKLEDTPNYLFQVITYGLLTADVSELLRVCRVERRTMKRLRLLAPYQSITPRPRDFWPTVLWRLTWLKARAHAALLPFLYR